MKEVHFGWVDQELPLRDDIWKELSLIGMIQSKNYQEKSQFLRKKWFGMFQGVAMCYYN